MKSKVINFGTANVDEIIKIDALPRIGETRFSDRFSALLGGKGANQAVAARKAGADVAFLGSVGTDGYGALVKKKLEENQIDTSYLLLSEKRPTGIAHVWADDANHNSILCYLGANVGNEEQQLKRLQEIVQSGDMILLTLEYKKDFVTEVAKIAEKYKCRLILDPSGNIEIAKDAEVAKRTYAIKPNEVEAEQLTGITILTEEDGIRAVEILRELGYAHPIVSMGERGAAAYIENEIRFFEPWKARSVDSTGAGDAFIGYLAAGLAKDCDLDRAIRIAAKAAALSTEKLGAAEAIPLLEEVERL